MYLDGQLRIVKRGDHITDTRSDDYGTASPGEVYLPHSCDEWVIGGPVEIEMLIENLQSVLTSRYTPVLDEA